MGLAWFKDKVEKVVTRKAATSSAPVHDENEAQTKRRYNLRKRKGQDENDHCSTNASESRRIILPQNDGQTKVSKLKTTVLIRRSKRGAAKRMVSTEQANENNRSSHKTPKGNQEKRIPTKTLNRKNKSSMNTIVNSRKNAKTLNKKSGKSTSVNIRKKINSLAVTETKTSSILTPALKRRVRSPPKGKHESSRKTNPSSQKKRKAARVKRSTPEEKLQIRTQRSKKERCRKELPGMFAKMFLKKLDLVSCINEVGRRP
ncbi:micronuclear linker histone polyprotein isoform X4 [Magallana gigas]|uniref:micronuclear linker histone polyprotein isoform X4 n=1 Tax=Magallana gigas TaxID=29159 RepID=UPI00334116DD